MSPRLRLLGQLLRPRRGRAALAAVATALSVGAALAGPWLAGRVVNHVVIEGSSSQLAVTGLALAAALVVGWIATTFETYLVAQVGQEALMDLRVRVVARLHLLPMRAFDEVSTGRVVSRITNDVDALNALVSGGLNQLMSSVLIVVGTLAAMLILDWQLALVTAFVFPLVGAASIFFRERSQPAWRTAGGALAEVTGFATEGIAGRAVVQAFGQEERHLAAFDRLVARNERAHVRPLALTRMFLPISDVAGTLGIAVVFAYGGREVATGGLELGTVVAFAAYLSQALTPMSQLGGLFASLQRGVAALDSIGEILDRAVDPARGPDRRRVTAVVGEIRLEAVRFAYRDESWVLREVSLEVPEGMTVALVGPSGSGKSTLVKLALGFYGPTAGRVLLDGRDLAELELASVRRHVAYVTQEPFLFTGTVADNVRWARPHADLHAVREAVRAVGALEVLERLPDALQTQVGERGERLSGGQRQLVALARAMMAEPRIVMLDEATSSVDVATEAHVQRALERLLHRRTALVVAHRLSTVRRADRIAVMQAGRIVETGTPSELRAAGGAFARAEAAFER